MYTKVHEKLSVLKVYVRHGIDTDSLVTMQ